MSDPQWSVTVQLGDPVRSKITTESLWFATREFAEKELAKLSDGQILKGKENYTLRNEIGEQITFAGERYISHSLHFVEPTSFQS